MLLRARRGVTYRGVTLSPPTRPRSPGFLMALTEIRARDGCQPGGRAAAVPPPGQHVLPDGVYPGRGTQPGGTGESTGPGGKKPALRALLRCCRLGQDVTWSRQLPLSFRAGEGGGRSLATVSPSFSPCPSLGSARDFASPRGGSENLPGLCESSLPLPVGINPNSQPRLSLSRPRTRACTSGAPETLAAMSVTPCS